MTSGLDEIGADALKLSIVLEARSQSLRSAVALARFAESLGLTGAWCSNALSSWDPYVLATVVGISTSTLNVGIFVSDPYTQHPVQIARSASTVQQAVGGRLLLGIGAGGAGFQVLGLNRTRPVDQVRSAVPLIRDAIAGRDLEVNNTTFCLNEALHTHVPIVIAARGRRMLQLAGQLADKVMISHHVSRASLEMAVDIVSAETLHRSAPDRSNVIVRVDICISDSLPAAIGVLKPAVALAIANSWTDADLFERLGVAAPDRDQREALQDNSHRLSQASMRHLVAAIPDEVVARLCWIGSADSVASHAHDVIGDLAGEVVAELHVVPPRTLAIDVKELAAAFVRHS